MKTGFAILLWVIVASAAYSCSQVPAPETYISDPNSVPVDISPVPGSSPSSAWIASFESQGETARFRIEFEAAKNTDRSVMNLPISSGKGRFVAMQVSNNGSLLIELKRALEAKKLPAKVQRVDELAFTYVNFGTKESQASNGGGFSPNPPGHWMVNKLFIGEGKNECEVFLNLNSVTKKVQFSIKDEEYGDECLAQFAKVL